MPARSGNGSPQPWQELEAALNHAASLLHEHHWAKGALARDATGAEVHPAASQAEALCIQGAFLRAGLSLPTGLILAGMQLLHRAAREVAGNPATDLFAFCDDPRTRKRDAIAVLERAAETARERAARLDKSQ